MTALPCARHRRRDPMCHIAVVPLKSCRVYLCARRMTLGRCGNQEPPGTPCLDESRAFLIFAWRVHKLILNARGVRPIKAAGSYNPRLSKSRQDMEPALAAKLPEKLRPGSRTAK